MKFDYNKFININDDNNDDRYTYLGLSCAWP